MNMITKLVNIETSAVVVLNTETSKAEQFRQAALEGAAIGRTSFMNLLSGKVEEACGWKLVVEAEVQQPQVALIQADTDLEAVIEALGFKGMKTNIKVASTEVYGTVVLDGLGRLQMNPTKKGFSLMFFPCKGAEVRDIETLGFKVKSEKAQYGRLETMCAVELLSMI